MTPLRAPSVAAVIQPASPASGEESIGVSLSCRHGCLFILRCVLFFFFFPHEVIKMYFSLSESHGFSHKSVLGPLIIVDPSDSKAHNTPQVSVSGADDQVQR